MIRLLIRVVLAITLTLSTTAYAQVAEAPTKTPETIKQTISRIAREYNVSEEVMNTVVECESQYNTNAVGDHGNSKGLVQIHRKYHPDITESQAFDPEFSLSFLAKNLANNKGYLWSCYRKNYK